MKSNVDTMVHELRKEMAEKKQKLGGRKYPLFQIVGLLFFLTIYLNFGYFIAGDIERFCDHRVGSGFTEVLMGRSISYFCIPDQIIAPDARYAAIQVLWPLVLLFSAGDWIILGIFQGGLIQLFHPWPN